MGKERTDREARLGRFVAINGGKRVGFSPLVQVLDLSLMYFSYAESVPKTDILASPHKGIPDLIDHSLFVEKSTVLSLFQ